MTALLAIPSIIIKLVNGVTFSFSYLTYLVVPIAPLIS